MATVIVLSNDEMAYAEFCQWIAKQPTEKPDPVERAIKSSLLRASGFDIAALSPRMLRWRRHIPYGNRNFIFDARLTARQTYSSRTAP